MILADTSVWVDHLRTPDATLDQLLDEERVLSHPFVTGEIAMGSHRERDSVLASLLNLPQAIIAKDDEVLKFITLHRLHGSGIGYIDTHLLVAARLTQDAMLWTRNKRLMAAAEAQGVAFNASVDLP
jgi:predicted nucleic acid-binding protein